MVRRRRCGLPPESSPTLALESPTNDELARAKRLRQTALRWYDQNGRHFPWRVTRDPYQILVAEMCLQKTNADKVLPVFEEIIKRYPNVVALAGAELSDLSKHFSRLGLFKRGDFLLQIARAIVDHYGGVIPKDRDTLLKVRGIGDYTANSVLCLAYGEPLPLLDGSTQRVLVRVFDRQADKPAWANKRMRYFMQAILPDDGAREFNLALIDIADKFCRPKKPKCDDCPIVGICLASNANRGVLNGL